MRQRILAGIAYLAIGTANGAPFLYHFEGAPLNPLASGAPPDAIVAMPTGVTHITADLVLSGPITPGTGSFVTPLTFSMSDGATIVDNTTAGYDSQFYLEAGVSGAIVSWGIRVDDALSGVNYSGQLIRMYSLWGDSHEDQTGYCFGSTDPFSGRCLAVVVRTNFYSPGSWTVSPVPVPATVWLLGSALGVLGALGRWRSVP
jgi:hypothetical protein